MAEMYRVSSDSLTGQRGSEIWPGEVSARVEESVQHVFLTGDALRDVELNHPTGHAGSHSERSYLMHFYPVRTEERLVRWVGVVAVEITERRKAEEALRKTEKLAATGRLAASIAHEINNPLEAVTNLLYLLSTLDSLDASAKELVETAQDELARVSEITQQTLRFYRQSTSPLRTDIAELIRSVVKLYQPRFSRANVSVVWKVRGEPRVFGYNGELRQVFANLIGNALDAMPDGGVLTLSIRRACGRLPDGSWHQGTRAFVSDNGCGMSATSQQKLFEPFFTTKQATGTGLGLWLSREIVSKHGGTVKVRSRQGRDHGTTFAFFFPDGGLRDPAAPPQ
jgi:signal transduction histidine kinase